MIQIDCVKDEVWTHVWYSEVGGSVWTITRDSVVALVMNSVGHIVGHSARDSARDSAMDTMRKR